LIYKAIQKYGWDKIDKEWYECPDDDLNKHEELMIEVLGTLTPGGYNLREGGGNGKLSDETKKKMSESHRGEKSHMYGKPKSLETKRRISEAHMGKTHTEETKSKLSEAHRGEKSHMYGKPLGEETKRKLSEAHMGITHTVETKQRMSDARRGDKNHNSKTVYQYTLDGVIVAFFGSSGEAANYLNKKCGTAIRRCARGEQKTAYDYKWTTSMSLFV
jgi:group I intron endonuclease